jgi:hypothetical protein
MQAKHITADKIEEDENDQITETDEESLSSDSLATS